MSQDILVITEQWLELHEFDNYAVSNLGRVRNLTTDLVKKPSRNQQGILMVNLSRNGEQNIRSVSVLVACAFVPTQGLPDHFDTPIHLDGDKANCQAVNLAWRPRWFAVRYHKQFDPWERTHRFGFRQPVELLDTGEVFPTSWEAAIKYGMLDREIFLATMNQTVVFPHHFRFRVID